MHACCSTRGRLRVRAGLIDPALPLLLGASAASAAVAGVLGGTVLLPRLKQLPERSLQLAAMRQRLLAQVGLLHHGQLTSCVCTKERGTWSHAQQLSLCPTRPEAASWPDRCVPLRNQQVLSSAAQHTALVKRMDALVTESCEDVRALGRLWQLRNKMQSVGVATSYGEGAVSGSLSLLHDPSSGHLPRMPTSCAKALQAGFVGCARGPNGEGCNRH